MDLPHKEELFRQSRQMTESRLANICANYIYEFYCRYADRYYTITQRAKERFENRKWRFHQEDASERITLYSEIITELEEDIRQLLGEPERLKDKMIWAGMKAVYSGLISERDDWDIAETFFNSITRRIFDTVGVDPRIEFVDTDFDSPPVEAKEPVYRSYHQAESNAELIHQIITDFDFDASYDDLERDAVLVAAHIEEKLSEIGALRTIQQIDMIKTPFFRGKAAYLVGRLFSGSHLVPLVMALHHEERGIYVDAVLMDEDDVSILFSFARSYFHIAIKRPFDLTKFLNTLIPRKRNAELYIAIGFNKHGKTELYRDLLRHLEYAGDRFVVARGKRGMVMSVFTMMNYDMVFKILKDQFGIPKETTPSQVKSKYKLVFQHDRAGRLVDTQEFEFLQFNKNRFSKDLLEELLSESARNIEVQEDRLVVNHCYVQRRVIPLDIYIREAHSGAAEKAVIDYGKAIKDLAASNIFAGDLLLKNFGVTRHGRVVFYDYDEITLLTDCNFRVMPEPQTYEQKMAAEPWFHVGPNDVFPEEFSRFLGLRGHLRQLFHEKHGDLFDVAFWHDTQERIQKGELIHIRPYHRDRRLKH